MTVRSPSASSSDAPGASIFRRVTRDILLISGAAGTAQVLAFAAAPFITRLYSPDTFGRFALFSAILTILYPLVTLRYDWALPLPPDDGKALDLLALCVVLIAGSTVALAILIPFASPLLTRWTGLAVSDLMLLPCAIAVFSLSSVATSWLTREQAFSDTACIRFTTTIGVVAGQIALGWMQAGATGLILGFIGGYLLGLAMGGGRLRRALARSARQVRLSGLGRAATEYRWFATITAPSNVVNALGLQLPNVAFQWLFGIAVTGQYSLAQRVLAQPTVLLGQAVNQVFWGAASRLSVQDPARLWPLFLRLNLGLFAAMAPGFVLSWYGAEIFSFVFGPAWAQAGGFAGAMVVASFVGLPAQGTTSLHVYGLNHWMGAWEVLQLLLVAGALLAAAQFELTPAECVVAVSAALALANAILLGLNALALRLAPQRRQVEPPSAGLVPVVEARR